MWISFDCKNSFVCSLGPIFWGDNFFVSALLFCIGLSGFPCIPLVYVRAASSAHFFANIFSHLPIKKFATRVDCMICNVQNKWKIRLQLTKPVTWPPLVWGVVCGAAASGTLFIFVGGLTLSLPQHFCLYLEFNVFQHVLALVCGA